MIDLTFPRPTDLVSRASFNERFSVLNELYQYWWKRKAVSGYYEYTQKLRNESYGFLSMLNQDSGEVQCANSIRLTSDGAIELVNPITINIPDTSGGGNALLNLVKPAIGKYSIVITKTGSSTHTAPCVFIPPDAVFSIDETGWQVLSNKYETIDVVYVEQSGDWEFISSVDRDTYPDSGEKDGYEYQYIGVPFENAREASKVVVGQYTGTGKFGLENPNQLIFENVPKVVMIPYCINDDMYQAYHSLSQQYYIWILNMNSLSTEYESFKGFGVQGSSNSQTPRGKKSADGKTIYWYNGDAERQFNTKGWDYNYIALI